MGCLQVIQVMVIFQLETHMQRLIDVALGLQPNLDK